MSDFRILSLKLTLIGAEERNCGWKELLGF
jgi:hypothetical protein